VYLAILTVTLGFGSFAADRIAAIFDRVHKCPADVTFLACAATMYALVICALYSCLSALIGRETPTPPISDEIDTYYHSTRYEDILDGMAREYLGAARRFRNVSDKKHAAANLAAHLLAVAIAFGVLGLSVHGRRGPAR
jgi:hypothetical protein